METTMRVVSALPDEVIVGVAAVTLTGIWILIRILFNRIRKIIVKPNTVEIEFDDGASSKLGSATRLPEDSRLIHQGGEPAEPPTPMSNDNGRGEPGNIPRDRISFPDARAFYGWLKDNGHLALAEQIGNREDLPVRIINWSPEAIDAATLEILERTRRAR